MRKRQLFGDHEKVEISQIQDGVKCVIFLEASPKAGKDNDSEDEMNLKIKTRFLLISPEGGGGTPQTLSYL